MPLYSMEIWHFSKKKAIYFGDLWHFIRSLVELKQELQSPYLVHTENLALTKNL